MCACVRVCVCACVRVVTCGGGEDVCDKCAHTRLHTRAQGTFVCTHLRRLYYTHARRACRRIPAGTCVCTQTHTRIHTHTHACVCIHTHTRTHTCTHACEFEVSHFSLVGMDGKPHTDADIDTQTDRHSHTHIQGERECVCVCERESVCV